MQDPTSDQSAQIVTLTHYDQLTPLHIPNCLHLSLLSCACSQWGDLFKHLSSLSLKSLKIQQCSLPDESLRALTRCCSLQTLRLADCGVTNAGARHLASSALPKLTSLSLDSNPITLWMFAMLLKQLTSLTTFRLELSHVTVLKAEVAGLTDRQLGFVVDNLQNLETLSIRWNFVTGKGLNGLEKLEKLRALTISHNAINDDGAKSICQLTNLNKLFIDSCGLTEESIMGLASSLPKLKQFSAERNGTHPRRIAEVRRQLRQLLPDGCAFCV